jgi:hypothetical protein
MSVLLSLYYTTNCGLKVVQHDPNDALAHLRAIILPKFKVKCISRFKNSVIGFFNGGIVPGVFDILLINNKGVRKTTINTFLSILLASLTLSISICVTQGMWYPIFSFKVFSISDPTFLIIAPSLVLC